MNTNSNNENFIKWKYWIANKIKEKMKEADCGIEYLAFMADLPEEYLFKVLQYQISPSRMAVEKIARALGVNKEEFNCPEELL